MLEPPTLRVVTGSYLNDKRFLLLRRGASADPNAGKIVGELVRNVILAYVLGAKGALSLGSGCGFVFPVLLLSGLSESNWRLELTRPDEDPYKEFCWPFSAGRCSRVSAVVIVICFHLR
jgi:hypothetical protein